jgi:hypothetical protein
MLIRDLNRDLSTLAGLRTSLRLGLVAGALSMTWVFAAPAAYSQVTVVHRYIDINKYVHVDPSSPTPTPSFSAGGNSSAGSGTSESPGTSTETYTKSIPVSTGSTSTSETTGTGNTGTGDTGTGNTGTSQPSGFPHGPATSPTPVPEPASIAAFGTALALFFGFAVARRRRG